MNSGSTRFETLPEILEWTAGETLGKPTLYVGGMPVSWKEVLEKSRLFATELISSDVAKGDRILILVPNSIEFFIAFYGVMISGAIAVPIFPEAGIDRCRQILKLCGGKYVILPAKIGEKRKFEFEEWVKHNNFQIHWISENFVSTKIKTFPPVFPDDIAFIQYTSGSTGFPKGVPLTHNNLIVNIKQMAEAMQVTYQDVFVSWLPVYHDMGLILNTMVPLYTGAVLVLLTDGLHSVSNWLKAIEKYRGTFISAPDIAYRLCVKSVRDPRDYDLSSLRVALNASEPVRGETYKMFEGTFNLKNVMISGYGLAEATVAVTMHPPGEPFVTDKNGYVSSGRPLKGISIRIDTSENRPGKMNTGEILVKSEALMKGYFNMPLSRELFDNEGFLRTGDIGYLDGNDNLFVLSRKKIIIIQGGITLYPDDVEQVVMETGNINKSFAIGLEPKPGTGEHLFVFAEYVHSKCADIETCHQLTVQIVKRIYDHFGLRPAGIYLLKPKSLPKTPNGKKQYFRLRSEFINRSPGLMSRILYPEIK